MLASVVLVHRPYKNVGVETWEEYIASFGLCASVLLFSQCSYVDGIIRSVLSFGRHQHKTLFIILFIYLFIGATGKDETLLNWAFCELYIWFG